MKAKKLELKKEVIASLNRSMMAEVMGGEPLGPTNSPSKCICMISEKSPCHTLGFDCSKVTDYPCKLSDACDTPGSKVRPLFVLARKSGNIFDPHKHEEEAKRFFLKKIK